jgi:hypothetical protein
LLIVEIEMTKWEILVFSTDDDAKLFVNKQLAKIRGLSGLFMHIFSLNGDTGRSLRKRIDMGHLEWRNISKRMTLRDWRAAKHRYDK